MALVARELTETFLQELESLMRHLPTELLDFPLPMNGFLIVVSQNSQKIGTGHKEVVCCLKP